MHLMYHFESNERRALFNPITLAIVLSYLRIRRNLEDNFLIETLHEVNYVFLGN